MRLCTTQSIRVTQDDLNFHRKIRTELLDTKITEIFLIAQVLIPLGYQVSSWYNSCLTLKSAQNIVHTLDEERNVLLVSLYVLSFNHLMKFTKLSVAVYLGPGCLEWQCHNSLVDSQPALEQPDPDFFYSLLCRNCGDVLKGFDVQGPLGLL